MDQGIPMSFMDQMQNLESERILRQKMFLLQFLAVSKMSDGKCSFESKDFLQYKKKCKKITKKIDIWHHELEIK